jgi:hypothetical protein
LKSRVIAAALLLACSGVPAPAFELDIGAGAAVDVAPYGIETVAPLAVIAPWVGDRGGLQAGLLLTASASNATRDVEAAACLRVWPAADRAALYGGAGVLLDLQDDLAAEPFAVAGLRLEAGRVAFLAPGLTIRFHRIGTDSGIWLAVLYRL